MRNYQKNWLLKTGLILMVIGVIVNIYFQHPLQKNSLDLTFISMLILAVIIAPIIEEIAFRGFLVFKKLMFWLSIILMAGYCLITFNFVTILLLVVFLLVLAFKIKTKSSNPAVLNVQIILSILLFSSVHYEFINYIDGDFVYWISYQLSMGFLMCWITLNFGLLKAILVHAVYNLLAIGIGVFVIFNHIDLEEKVIENKHYKASYQREINLLPNYEKKFTADFYSFEVIRMTPSKIHEFIVLSFNDNQFVKNEHIFNMEPFVNYNIHFVLKDTTSSLEKEFILFCIEEELIIKNEDVLRMKSSEK